MSRPATDPPEGRENDGGSAGYVSRGDGEGGAGSGAGGGRGVLKTTPDELEYFNRHYIDEDGNVPSVGDDDRSWSDGIRPLRRIHPEEMEPGFPNPSDEMLEYAERFEDLDAEEQTTGPGLGELPPYDGKKSRTLWSSANSCRDYMLVMPHPKYEWPSYLLDRRLKIPYYRMRQTGLLISCGDIERHDGNSKRSGVWRVHPDAWKMIYERHESAEDRLPCGHAGFVNLGGGDYSCSNEYCLTIYPREVVKEVFG